jgi:virginiamycin A acetyltransferase
MAIIRTLIDKYMLRTAGRNEYESLALRRYFQRTYNIRVGLYSIGAFDRWRVPPDTIVGRYCSIAKSSRLLDGNHPIDQLSTHPYFYLKQFGIVDVDKAVVQAPVVEDDVWLGHNCTIMPGCHVIGRGAIVGAGAIVMGDVPRYAIMSGAPAKLVRYRFAPEVIEAVEATQWWTLDKPQLEAALRQAPGFATNPTRENANAFLRALGRPELPPASTQAAAIAPVVAGRGASPEAVMGLLRREIPEFQDSDLDRPLLDLKIDSFGLINLRILLEGLIERQIPDSQWGAVQTPADLLKLAGAVAATAPAAVSRPVIEIPLGAIASGQRPGGERRMQDVNMPQMALSGLSEPWLFKELGDLHWSVLTRGLQTPSAAVADSEGARLYATFTRIRLSADQPLTNISENDSLALDLDMERFGAGMFFSTARLEGATGSAEARIMTSFSKFGEAGSNTSLLKGQPVIPDNCEIPALPALPDFAQEYRAQRAAELPAAIYETEYDILPPHDINGVGLLYFAAYPTIIDLCAARKYGPRLFADFSTTFRDIGYYANSGPQETLVFRIHREEVDDGKIAYDATLSRKSDGKTMCFVSTTKSRILIRSAASMGKPATVPARALT